MAQNGRRLVGISFAVSLPAVAREAGCDVEVVRRCLAALESAGYVERDGTRLLWFDQRRREREEQAKQAMRRPMPREKITPTLR